jgi:hypothetical protein
MDIFIKTTGRLGNTKKTVLSRSKRYIWSAYLEHRFSVHFEDVVKMGRWLSQCIEYLRVYLCTEDNIQITNHHCCHLSTQIGDIVVGKPYHKGHVIGDGFAYNRLVMVTYKIRPSFFSSQPTKFLYYSFDYFRRR